MVTVVADTRLIELVDPNAQPEKIATGYQFTEGPVWDSRDQTLTFSDERDNTMYRWTESGGATTYRKPSQGSNGNTLDGEGCLITCEESARRVSRTKADGSIETIVSHYQGSRLNSPNDVVVTRAGDIIFTDPPYGLRQPDGSIVGQEIPFCGVYRVGSVGGSISVLAEDFERPNGVVLTADDSHLLVADTAQGHVRIFEMTPGGALRNGRILVDQFPGRTGVGRGPRPDGMKLDSLGNLYVAANSPEGIWVFSPDGDFLGTIGLDETPANLAWGGDDWQTLFVTASKSVYRIPMKVSGQQVPRS
jgi:sugar lactone lactonase YvrE